MGGWVLHDWLIDSFLPSGTNKSLSLVATVTACRCHLPLMFEGKVFICKLFSINGLSTRPVATREIASLTHEPRNDAMKCRSLEVQDLSRSVIEGIERNNVWYDVIDVSERVDRSMDYIWALQNESLLDACINASMHARTYLPTPFSPVQRHRKFSAVLGTTSARNSISMRPLGEPPMEMSKKTTGFSLLMVMVVVSVLVLVE